jgi:hypothetical protein
MIIIDAPHFYAAVIFEWERVVRAAPILKYMEDWHYDLVLAYARKKRWKVIELQ